MVWFYMIIFPIVTYITPNPLQGEEFFKSLIQCLSSQISLKNNIVQLDSHAIDK